MKLEFKKKFGVTPQEVVMRFDEMIRKREEFKVIHGTHLSKKEVALAFNWDVTDLDNWKSTNFPDVATDIIGESEFLKRMKLEEGVKGTREISIMNADVALQAFTGCTLSPDGSVVFTGVDLSTTLLGSAIEFCNETLNGKTSEMLNSLGVKGQNDHIPYDIESILMMYLSLLLRKRLQRLILLGDTTSLDTNLQFFDGLFKRLKADALVPIVTSTETTITPTNAIDVITTLALGINADLYDSGADTAIVVGNDVLRMVALAWNKANPYTTVDVPMGDGSFTLPDTGIEVLGVRELNGTNEAYIIPFAYLYLGTDLMSDIDFDVKYDEYNDKLKVEAKFRIGYQYIFPQYFAKLDLA